MENVYRKLVYIPLAHFTCTLYICTALCALLHGLFHDFDSVHFQKTETTLVMEQT